MIEIDMKIHFVLTGICADKVRKRIGRVFYPNTIGRKGVESGWCRRVLVEGNITYVGFTRIRQTTTKGNVAWLLGKLSGKDMLPSRIAIYDLIQHRKPGEVVLPCGEIDAVYGAVRA